MPIIISFGRLLSNPIGSLDELMERTVIAADRVKAEEDIVDASAL